MALLSTLNSSFAYNAITIGQSCDDGWLPAVFGKKNKKDARVWILTFMYIMGMIPILAGLSITVITNMVQLFTSCFAILNFIAYMKMPKLYPEAWKKSRFHISNGLYYAICIISLVLSLVILWKSLLSMTPVVTMLNVVMVVLFAIIGYVVGKSANVTIHTSLWAETGENMA